MARDTAIAGFPVMVPMVTERVSVAERDLTEATERQQAFLTELDARQAQIDRLTAELDTLRVRRAVRKALGRAKARTFGR